MRRADRRVSLAAIIGSIEAGVDDVYGVLFHRISEDARVIPGALPQVALFVDFGPGSSAVVGAKYAAVFGFDDRPNTVRHLRRDSDADASENTFRHAGVTAQIG